MRRKIIWVALVLFVGATIYWNSKKQEAETVANDPPVTAEVPASEPIQPPAAEESKVTETTKPTITPAPTPKKR